MNKKGFTLIELLIVVAIIGIIAAIVIPNIMMALQKGKQKSTMEDMRNLGHACQMYAEGTDFVPQTADMNALAAHDYFVENYIRIVPQKDHWGVLMTYTTNVGERQDETGAIVLINPATVPSEEYTIMAGGRDGAFKTPSPLPWKILTMDDFNYALHYSSGGFSQAPSRVK